MDLQVVGRHALFFDDDSMATFVNSPTALVDWNSLFIDRYDVRHLLSSPPPPPRPKRRRPITDDPGLEPELDHERYLDLPTESPSQSHDENDINDASGNTNADGYRAVPFSYGSTSDFNDQKLADTEVEFHPPFAVPDYLLQNLMLGEEMELSKVAIHRHLVSFCCHDKGRCSYVGFQHPPTEKLHQIIAKTSSFVSKHGGQSEIVLRVKQGGNPTFGFLMPDHHLHPYFRFLVEHQELLTGKSSVEDKKIEGGKDGGALSLLGSVYGTAEDEDAKEESAKDSKTNESAEGDDGVKEADPNGPERSEGPAKIAAVKDAASKHSLPWNNKASLVKKNPSVSAVNVAERKQIDTEDNATEKLLASNKLQSSTMPVQPKLELQIVEPPIEMKRVIEKIVDFIQKNGKELEATLAAQDVKYGMFPFLRPVSLYHAYYRKVLQEADELKSCEKGDVTKKEDMQQKMGIAVKNDKAVGSELPDDSAKKEKSKMVSDKPMIESHVEPFKPVQPQMRVTVDANTAAAILQAARRGIRNPQLGILSGKPFDETSQSLGNDGSCPPSNSFNLAKNTGQMISGSAAASEADSSEAGLSKEQKLKAERLKRAKMFVAMLKPGSQPVQAEPSRSLSVEPLDSVGSGLDANAGKERESSSVPSEAETKQADDGNYERRSKRNYRSRSQRDEDDEMGKKEDDEGSSMEEVTEETKTEKKHSSRKRHDRRHKHKTRDCSKDRHSRDKHKHKHESSSDDECHSRWRSRHKHRKSSDRHEVYDCSDDECEHRHRTSRHKKEVDYGRDKRSHHYGSRKHGNSSDDEDRYQKHRSSRRKHEKSSEDEEHGGHRHKCSKRMKKDEKRVEEEESVSISKCAPGENEASQVSDELRAKIRAMLADTL